MGKNKTPTVQQFLQKKTIYGQKKDPVWIYLEREMRENIEKKPYNVKVGNWLKFLRDLKHYYYCEGKKKLKRLTNEVGPSWYCELSSAQREVLNHLKENIHQDLLEDLPIRIRKSLSDLGVTLKIPKPTLMKAMNDSISDPGVFIWNLYSAYYKKPPSELRPAERRPLLNINLPKDLQTGWSCAAMYSPGIGIQSRLIQALHRENWLRVAETTKMAEPFGSTDFLANILQDLAPLLLFRCFGAIFITAVYDINGMILMSCLVFIDLEECIERLEKLVNSEKTPAPDKQKNKNKYYEPKVRYGEYLQQMFVPCYSTHSSGRNKKQNEEPLGYKFRLRSEESYEKLCKDQSFLEKRKERNKKAKQTERVCSYKFWEPPSTLRNTDPKMVAYVNKLKMLKQKAKAKYKSPYKNVQYLVSGVSFSGGKPNYILSNVSSLPTGYIPLNGGIVDFEGSMITAINGYWKFPKEVRRKCDDRCDCLAKWESTVMDFLKESKCKCGHLYDLYNEGKAKEKYFYPPTRHGKYWIDNAKIYQMDPIEDFIKDTFRDAMMSGEPSPKTSTPTISATGLKEKDLLAALLADLSDTPLLIPHLPQANLLNNLQEWARKRVKGKLTPKQHKQLILKSQRRWLDLKHMDFRARAYRIPFTLKQLHNMNWSHRQMVQTLFEILLNDFVTRNRMNQLEQTRLWWSTMKYDAYPSKAFLDIYFTYMPGRMKDTFLINPYSSELTPKHGAKTCPL